MMNVVLLPLVAASLFFFGLSPVSAEGGKNRLGDEDIEEGYQLCQQEGVEQVVIEEDGLTVVIDCETAPEPSSK